MQRLTSWRDLPAAQQPEWPGDGPIAHVVTELRRRPPLVQPAECDRLRAQLADAARGRAFALQGGDCAETFDRVSTDAVHGKLETLLHMAMILASASVPVVKIGRFAGQYAKPRSAPTETRGGTTLPVYRGDAVNASEFTAEARTPDAGRLLRAYHASAATLDIVRRLRLAGPAHTTSQ